MSSAESGNKLCTERNRWKTENEWKSTAKS